MRRRAAAQETLGAVGSERAVERIEVLIWPSSDTLEVIVVIELILLIGKSGSKVLLPAKMLAAM